MSEQPITRPDLAATTRLLADLAAGRPDAVNQLLPLVYDELRRLAARYLGNERHGHTLQPTALVNETYLRLVGSADAGFQNRAHFVAVAAKAMRHVLVNHALARSAEKRGGAAARLPLDDAVTLFEERSADLRQLDDALNALAEVDPQQARIVELRFFGGLTIEETAQVTGVSARTVEREWTLARAWLRREISPT